MSDFSKKPTQPPAADMNFLIARVNELSKKVLNKGFTSTLPTWKRWVGGETEYDGSGLRDVVNANAIALDAVKNSLDTFKDNSATVNAEQNQRLSALEAQITNPPFPG